MSTTQPSTTPELQARLKQWLRLPDRDPYRDVLGPELILATLMAVLGPLFDLLPWIVSVLALPIVVVLLVTVRRLRRRRPRVMWDPSLDAATAATLELGPLAEVVHLDGTKIHDAASLARALDEALGGFQFPEEPLAHVNFELRGSGTKVLLWTDARNLVANDPATFGAFVTAWKPGPPPKLEQTRLLAIDLPDPNGEVARAA